MQTDSRLEHLDSVMLVTNCAMMTSLGKGCVPLRSWPPGLPRSLFKLKFSESIIPQSTFMQGVNYRSQILFRKILIGSEDKSRIILNVSK